MEQAHIKNNIITYPLDHKNYPLMDLYRENHTFDCRELKKLLPESIIEIGRAHV